MAAVSWHANKQRIALALEEVNRAGKGDGRSYYIASYNVTLEVWEHSSMKDKDERQKDVKCMEWAPCSAATLAVGCKAGVLIWRISDITLAYQKKMQARAGARAEQPWAFVDGDDAVDEQSVTRQEEDSTAQAEFLPQASGQPVESLAWNSTGTLLAVCARADRAIYVWDVATCKSTPLRKLGYAAPTGLYWSPNGSHLFATTTEKKCVAWETQTWQAWQGLDWGALPGRRCEVGRA